MIVINDASSHHTSISKMPNVAASEVAKATMIARLMSASSGVHEVAAKRHAAIPEDECSEHRENETRAGEGRGRTVLNVRRPKYDRNCESETQPEFVAKHRNGVPGVTVVGPVKVRHLVTGVWEGCPSMISMCRVIHFELQLQAVATPPLLSMTCSEELSLRRRFDPSLKPSRNDGVKGAPDGISVPRWSLSKTHLKGSRRAPSSTWRRQDASEPLYEGLGRRNQWDLGRCRFADSFAWASARLLGRQ